MSRVKTYDKVYRQLNADKLKAKRRIRLLYKLYGLTETQYYALYKAQEGKCAICGSCNWLGKGRQPNVDHCHSTREVRGLLCMKCNSGLGYFNDKPELLQAAIDYLLNTKTRWNNGEDSGPEADY